LEVRSAALQARINFYVGMGYRVISQTDTTAQLVRPKRFSLVWFLIWLLLLIGWLFYLFYHLFLKREIQVYLSVDELGRVNERESRR
jgi:hypothetical protein